MNFAYSYVRDPRWADESKTQIICFVKFDYFKVEVSFRASSNDTVAHGRRIYAQCMNGDFGPVKNAEKMENARYAESVGSQKPPNFGIPFEEFQEFIDELNLENSRGTLRGIILTQSSMIEKILGEILEVFFVESAVSRALIWKSASGALGSFSSRANVCFALGLIGKNELGACKQVRLIRNHAAHNWNLSGPNSSFAKSCNPAFKSLYGEFYSELYHWQGEDLEFLVRAVYHGACGEIVMKLLSRLVEAKAQRRSAC